MMRFFLDGTLVDPATNWQEVSSTIRKDKELNVFLLFQEYTLSFDGSGFDYLVNLVNNDSFCREVDIAIEKKCDEFWQVIFSGVFFVSDCEVNEKTGVIKVKVNDKSFFSKINNNKNIKTSLEGAKTKNNIDITAIQQYDVSVYTVDANTLKYAVPCCRVEEAFRYFVDFMTDNTVSFASNTFGAGGDWEGLALTTGERMRGVVPTNTDARWNPFSFLTLFTEVNNRVPIILLVENPFTNPVIRIESIDYLYGSGINMIADNVDEINTSFDTDKLYALVKFGSPTDDTFTLDFPESIDYYGYKEEEFHLLGKCNLDRTLDLKSDWIVSSNLIQRMVDLGHQDFDSDTVLIDTIYTSDTLGRTTNDNFLAVVPARYHYNARLNNEQISTRYIEDLSAQIAAYYINSKEGQMYGYSSTVLAHTVAANNEDFTNFIDLESYDYGNFYDTGTARYTATEAMQVTIEAQVTIQFGVATLAAGNIFRWIIEQYNSSNTLINSYFIGNSNATYAGLPYIQLGGANGSTTSKKLNASINLANGDYLKMRIQSWPLTNGGPGVGAIIGTQLYSILNNASQTYFKVLSTSLTGGTFLDIDPDDIKVQKHKFKYPMQQQTFDTILANPIGRIGFGMASQAFRYGWIDELKYNHSTNIADFTIITNRKSQNAY